MLHTCASEVSSAYYGFPATFSTPQDSVPSFKASSGGTSPGKPAQIPPIMGPSSFPRT